MKIRIVSLKKYNLSSEGKRSLEYNFVVYLCLLLILEEMVSTTVEKVLFIAFGLIIFSIVGLPLYNIIQDLVDKDTESRNFEYIVNQIDYNIHKIEDDNTFVYEGYLVCPEGFSMELFENSYTIKVKVDHSDLQLEEIIYSGAYAIHLVYAGDVGDMVLRMACFGGKIEINLSRIEI
jgi:hypothetical protein